MKKAIFTYVLLLISISSYAQSTVKGDMNDDGILTVTDVMLLINVIIGNESQQQGYLSCPDENHPHAIDLGLPSGTRWACCNVDAETPMESGGYYAWGETEVKDMYNEVTYLYCTGTDTNGDGYYEKDYNDLDIGSDIAGTEYDVAHIKWDGSWTMPTIEQIDELLNHCIPTWTTINGVYGRKFTGVNGGCIFLPAVGSMRENKRYGSSTGYYWSSTHNTANPGYARTLQISSSSINRGNSFRYAGCSVRPVCK